MSRNSMFHIRLGSLLLVTSLVCVAQIAAPRLRDGDMFPQVAGQTPNGKALQLPPIGTDRPIVLIFSLTKRAGVDARHWDDRLSRDFPGATVDDQVIILESVPKLFRGMAVSSIRNNMPLSLQDRTILLYQDEGLWKHRLGVTDVNRSYAVLLKPNGRVHWSSSTGFTETEYLQLKMDFEKLGSPHART
jgi:hypothetical protein